MPQSIAIEIPAVMSFAMHHRRCAPFVRVVVAGAVALGVGATTAACAVGPKYQRPAVAVDPTWTAAKTAPDEATHVDAKQTTPDKWWESFGDATLDRLVEMAVQQNLSLQVAGLRMMEARAQLALATGRQYPHIAVVGEATAVGLSKNLPYVTNLPNFDRQFLSFDAGFDASWEVDLWGKARGAVDVEHASLAASQTDYDFALISLAAEVARTYAVVRTNEVLIAQARENEKLQEDGLKLAEARSKNGATSELDVAQATSLLASTRASVPRLQTKLQAARDALATLLGLNASGVEGLLLTSDANAAPSIPAPPASVPVGVPADMLRRRPDIQSAEHRAVAQSARIGIAEADFYPVLALTGNVGLQTTTANNLDVNPADMLNYRAGPELVWQIFDFGRTENAVRVEDARYQQTLADYQDAVLKAAQEVEDAMATFQNAERAIAFEQTAVDAERRAVEIALVQYREGAADYQRVLDAQRSLLDEETVLAQTRSDAATGVIALYKALGGGWQAFQNEAVPSARVKNDMQGRTNWGDLLTQPRSNTTTSTTTPTSTQAPEAGTNKAGQP